MQKKKRERERRERKHWGGEEREREDRSMMRRERKIYFLYVRTESKVHLQTSLGAARNLGTCCCVHSKWRGGGKKKNKNESSPIQLGEGTSTLRQGFIQEGLSPSLDERKSHSSSACVMYFVLCTDEMYVQVCVCNR